MTAAVGSLVAHLSVLAQGTPLSPSLHTRLIALVIVEAFLLTTAVLLYLLWVRFKDQPLDEWWQGRKAAGFSPRTRALMEESERARRAEAGSEEPRPLPPEHGPPT